MNNQREGYGEKILLQTAKKLIVLYGNGFDRPNISRMVKFSKLYPIKEICVTLSHQLSWSHIVKLIAIEEDIKRYFYAEMCRLERWNIKVFRQNIDGMLYERTAISKHPKSVVIPFPEINLEHDLLST